MKRDKYVRISDAGLGYSETGDFTTYIVTWILGKPNSEMGGNVHFVTGCVIANGEESLKKQLDDLSTTTYEEFAILEVKYIELHQMLDELKEEWQAKDVIDKFWDNVDKSKGYK